MKNPYLCTGKRVRIREGSLDGVKEILVRQRQIKD